MLFVCHWPLDILILCTLRCINNMIPSAILYGTFSIGNVNELTYDETLCSQKAGTQSLT
jgi:hypothetical protein